MGLSQEQERGQEVRQQIQAGLKHADYIATFCECRRPVLGYPKMGQRWCRLCGKRDRREWRREVRG